VDVDDAALDRVIEHGFDPRYGARALKREVQRQIVMPLAVTLMEQPNRVLSSEVLVRRVWGEEYASDSDYVRRYIWYLRQKIEPNPDDPAYIRNERNIGYYFASS